MGSGISHTSEADDEAGTGNEEKHMQATMRIKSVMQAEMTRKNCTCRANSYLSIVTMTTLLMSQVRRLNGRLPF